MPMFLTITCYYDQEIESKLQLLLKESKISMENLEQIEKDESIICPFDSSHRIPKESYANHMVILLIQFHKQWHVHHYNTQFDLNEDIDFFYESAPNLHRIHLDSQQQQSKTGLIFKILLLYRISSTTIKSESTTIN